MFQARLCYNHGMKLYYFGHDYRYAAEQMLATLFPGEKPEYPAQGGAEGWRIELRHPASIITVSRNPALLPECEPRN